MKRLALLTIGVLLIVPLGACAQKRVPLQVSPQTDIVGFYECEGKNPDGSSYRGFAEITSVRDTFRVRWTFDDGQVLGVGIWSNGVLAVSYFVGAPTVVVYKVEGNRLVGEWVMGGAEGRVSPDVLTKTDKRPPPPEPREPPPAKPEQQERPGIRI